MQGSLIDFADGVPTDDLTKKLVNMSTTFETQGRNFGKMSTAEANNFLKNVAGELNERMGDMSPAMLDNLRKTMPDLYEALELGGRMKLIQQMDGSFILFDCCAGAGILVRIFRGIHRWCKSDRKL